MPVQWVQNPAMDTRTDGCRAEIAASAARLVVQDGLDYGPAKRQAAHLLGLPARVALPDNLEVEDAVFEYIALFCPDTQRQELAALRALAVRWMERLQPFRPYLCASVWHGSATRNSDLRIELFCDDAKSAELALIDMRVRYTPQTVTGWGGETVEALCVMDRCPGIDAPVAVHLLVYDHDQLRGALRPDARGRTPRADLAALRLRMEQDQATPPGSLPNAAGSHRRQG